MIAEGVLGSAAKAIFGPMANFLTFCYSTWRLDKKERFALRSTIYKEQFLPAFDKMSKIHQNYMESLHDFYELARKFETPHVELIAKFRRYGMEYTSWGEDVKCFAELCHVISHNSIFKPEKDAIKEFADAITNYFAATSPSGPTAPRSWFTSFLNEFEDHARRGQSPWDEEYEGKGYMNPKGVLMDYLRTVYQIELPNRWSRVTKAKAALQAALVAPP